MAVKFVFEDFENTPSSVLLKSSYNGNNIYFSGGCSKVLNKALKIQEPDDIVYIFYDVSPNNKHTVKAYNALIEKIAEDEYENIYVIPIICIEYYISKFLNNINALTTTKLNEELVNKIVKEFDWASISDKWKNDVFVGSSLEHAYKYIIDNTKQKCVINSFEYEKDKTTRKNSIKGIFYEKGCDCPRIYCKADCNMCLKEKAERLYTTLPAYTVSSDEHRKFLETIGINLHKVSNADIKKHIQILYNKICDNMGINRIKIRI